MEIPQSWRGALLRLEPDFPEVMIGGGALRDLDHGAPIKDVDIFVMSRSNTKELLDKAFGQIGVTVVSEGASAYLDLDDDVLSVFEYRTEGQAPFQVIVSNPACEIPHFFFYQLARFDIGLCRVAYSRTFGVIQHNTYLEDKAAKVLRIRDPRRIPRSITRAERIGAKYPGYRIVVPDDDIFTS